MAIDFAASPYYEGSFAQVTSTPVTLAAWLNPDDATGSYGLYGLFDASTGVNWLALRQHSDGTIQAYARSSGGNGIASSSGTVTNGTWHHACAVFSASNSRTAYLDGVAGTENTDSRTPTGIDTTSIARFGDSTPSSQLNGQIAHAAMWSVALTADEVAALANGVSPLLIRPSALVEYRPLRNTTMGAKCLLGSTDLTVSGSPGNAASDPPVIQIGAIRTGGGGTGGGGDSVTLNDPDAYRVLVRAADGNGDIVISGSYTGTPTNIEYRLVQHGTDTPVSGHDWQTLEAGPTGGTFSGTVSDIPAGGWYNVDVRFSNDTGVTDNGTNRWGVGFLIGLIGQSNGRNLAETAGTYAVTNEVGHYIGTTAIGETTDVWALKENVGTAKMGDVVSGALSMPVGIVKYANGSTALNSASDQGNGYWLDQTASSVYDNFQAGVNALGGALDAVVWDQGETERYGDPTTERYYTDLGTLRTTIAGDIAAANGASSIPFFILQTGAHTGAAAEDGSLEFTVIRRAQQLYANDNADAYCCAKVDKPTTDGVHYSGANYIIFGDRIAQAILHHLGQAADWPPPVCATWAIVNATTVDVTLTHGDGSDFTPTSGITGFEVRVNGLWEAPSAAVRQSNIVIRLTHSSGTADRVRYAVGRGPTMTSPVVDNTTTSLPLMPSDDIPQQASAGGGGGRLVNGGLVQS